MVCDFPKHVVAYAEKPSVCDAPTLDCFPSGLWLQRTETPCAAFISSQANTLGLERTDGGWLHRSQAESSPYPSQHPHSWNTRPVKSVWFSLMAALTTEEKGVFLGLGCWEAVGGRWYPQKDRHPQLPEAEGDPELWQALRLPTERAEVGRQRKGREACGRPTRSEFCIPTLEGCMSCLWPGEDAPFPVPESWLHRLSLQGLTKSLTTELQS